MGLRGSVAMVVNLQTVYSVSAHGLSTVSAQSCNVVNTRHESNCKKTV